ncbi:YndJ family protein [Phycicoccus sp. Root101]|uniref:YndJ family protein n=1 Tax=Phycicoccus sp. Root101 TaxID=1736421 RepID=UPI0007029A6C|nr:YndJ family protein [Phycicoccus sp. Root101]KQU70564.1 hypothetical protein ASC58_01815 [Phycicoccus sp. Root101]
MTVVVNLVVTLGMLVIVPLGLRLLPVAGTLALARAYPVFAVPGVVALWLPRGVLSTTLAGWYGVGTLLLALLGVRHGWNCLSRRTLRGADAAAVTALVCPAIAAFALVSERASTEVFGFSLKILALTVPHFHFAGFAAALVAHLVATTHPSPVTTAAAWSVPSGTLVVLLGYFVNDEVELLGAVILTAGMWLVGWTLWTRGRAGTRDSRTRLLLGVSAVTLVLTMLLALDWALGHVVDAVPHLPIEWMAWTHGLANAVGFALCALCALARPTRIESRP